VEDVEAVGGPDEVLPLLDSISRLAASLPHTSHSPHNSVGDFTKINPPMSTLFNAVGVGGLSEEADGTRQ
jgi:hypothetical protein